MSDNIRTPAPMLALGQEEIPAGEGWLYEPKWDGFRAIADTGAGQVVLASRNGQPLERYFPELLPQVEAALPPDSWVDGEIVVAGPRGLDFELLSQRIHPAASRVNRLSVETPATFIAFDALRTGGRDIASAPFAERRRELEWALVTGPGVVLTPITDDREEASRWFEEFEGAGFDGIVAKRSELPYRPGERVMIKVKHHRTVDCVVGGFRTAAKGGGVGSLLLGLHDDSGTLHYCGHTSSFNATERIQVHQMLSPHIGGESFTEGRSPGGPSRWTGKKDLSWNSVAPVLVCEVHFDQLQGGRFRHAARFLRWRSDKSPRECTYRQLEPPRPFELAEVIALGRRLTV
ncbi:MAG: ATP-dependent DNA ligase [Candidatus Dormibacteria bacterium]